MTNILEISDGTTTINLLSQDFGFCLNNWQPAIAQPKRGGIYQSSSLSEGRKLVDRKFENIDDSFNFDIKGSGQPETILYITNLINLLEQAAEYWTKKSGTKVWIKAKADCEDSPRYALIVNYSWPNLKFPYGSTFFKPGEIASMINVDLGIEHGLWLANKPGDSDCIEASAVQDWNYINEWAEETTTPEIIITVIRKSNDNLYTCGGVGESGEIWKSTDDGDTWVLNRNLTARGRGIFETSAGTLLAAHGSNVERSINDGAAWATIALPGGSTVTDGGTFAEADNGDILLFSWDTSEVLNSNDDGASWAVFTTTSQGAHGRPVTLSNGDILVGGTSIGLVNGVERSQDNGATWSLVSTLSGTSTQIYQVYQLANGNIVAFNGGNVWISTDIDTDPFAFRNSAPGLVRGMDENPSGTVWMAGPSGDVYKTIDEFNTITTDHDRGVEETWDVVVADDNNVIAVGNEDDNNGFIIRRILSSTDMGRAATCTNEVYLANKQNIANLTHIKIDDGGVFTDVFPIAAFPQNLLPAVPVVNDAVYFGSDTANINSGPFADLVFDISQIASVSGGAPSSFTIVWEYWNGAWVTLTTHDNTGTPFTILGVNSVHWEQPNDWATTAIDGITAYWVRARLSALNGTLTPPQQQNRDIYTIVQPFVNIAATEINGNVASLLREKLENQSDADGRGGSGPDLWDNRIITGLREYNIGVNFQAYLNVADEQNPTGVTVTATGANTAFATDVTTPTGRRATYNPAGVEAMATQVTIALGSTIARDFYGKYHAFLRVQRTAGAITDFDVQLQLVSGSGGIQDTTKSVQVQTTTQWELLDLGQVEMPVGGTFKSTDLGDTTEIRIQASAASGTPNLNIYDLILIPVDEWSVDSIDFANTSDSIIGQDDSVPKLLDVDSITNPKIDIQSLVRVASNDFITSVYDPISPGKAVLQENAQQRLWFLAAQTDQTGTPIAWIAPPEIAHSIQLFKNERYLVFSKGITL